MANSIAALDRAVGTEKYSLGAGDVETVMYLVFDRNVFETH